MPSGRMMRLEKLDSGEIDHDDGLIIRYKTSKPNHLQFWCKTSNSTSDIVESCDVRLYKANLTGNEVDDKEGYECEGTLSFQESDRALERLENPLFFRFGYHKQMKLNW